MLTYYVFAIPLFGKQIDGPKTDIRWQLIRIYAYEDNQL